jgi:hypothetical protein
MTVCGSMRRPCLSPDPCASLVAAALADARRLQLPEAAQIETIIRSMGGDPNRAPFA